MTEDLTYDLYGDLDDFSLEQKLQKKNEEYNILQNKYLNSLKIIEELQNEIKELKSNTKIINRNYSSLLLTARSEIKRKDNQIVALRKEKDDICFRRVNRSSDQKQINTLPFNNPSEIRHNNKEISHNQNVKLLHKNYEQNTVVSHQPNKSKIITTTSSDPRIKQKIIHENTSVKLLSSHQQNPTNDPRLKSSINHERQKSVHKVLSKNDGGWNRESVQIPRNYGDLDNVNEQIPQNKLKRKHDEESGGSNQKRTKRDVIVEEKGGEIMIQIKVNDHSREKIEKHQNLNEKSNKIEQFKNDERKTKKYISFNDYKILQEKRNPSDLREKIESLSHQKNTNENEHQQQGLCDETVKSQNIHVPMKNLKSDKLKKLKTASNTQIDSEILKDIEILKQNGQTDNIDQEKKQVLNKKNDGEMNTELISEAIENALFNDFEYERITETNDILHKSNSENSEVNISTDLYSDLPESNVLEAKLDFPMPLIEATENKEEIKFDLNDYTKKNVEKDNFVPVPMPQVEIKSDEKDNLVPVPMPQVEIKSDEKDNLVPVPLPQIEIKPDELKPLEFNQNKNDNTSKTNHGNEFSNQIIKNSNIETKQQQQSKDISTGSQLQSEIIPKEENGSSEQSEIKHLKINESTTIISKSKQNNDHVLENGPKKLENFGKETNPKQIIKKSKPTTVRENKKKMITVMPIIEIIPKKEIELTEDEPIQENLLESENTLLSEGSSNPISIVHEKNVDIVQNNTAINESFETMDKNNVADDRQIFKKSDKLLENENVEKSMMKENQLPENKIIQSNLNNTAIGINHEQDVTYKPNLLEHLTSFQQDKTSANQSAVNQSVEEKVSNKNDSQSIQKKNRKQISPKKINTTDEINSILSAVYGEISKSTATCLSNNLNDKCKKKRTTSGSSKRCPKMIGHRIEGFEPVGHSHEILEASKLKNVLFEEVLKSAPIPDNKISINQQKFDEKQIYNNTPNKGSDHILNEPEIIKKNDNENEKNDPTGIGIVEISHKLIEKYENVNSNKMKVCDNNQLEENLKTLNSNDKKPLKPILKKNSNNEIKRKRGRPKKVNEKSKEIEMEEETKPIAVVTPKKVVFQEMDSIEETIQAVNSILMPIDQIENNEKIEDYTIDSCYIENSEIKQQNEIEIVNNIAINADDKTNSIENHQENAFCELNQIDVNQMKTTTKNDIESLELIRNAEDTRNHDNHENHHQELSIIENESNDKQKNDSIKNNQNILIENEKNIQNTKLISLTETENENIEKNTKSNNNTFHEKIENIIKNSRNDDELFDQVFLRVSPFDDNSNHNNHHHNNNIQEDLSFNSSEGNNNEYREIEKDIEELFENSSNETVIVRKITATATTAVATISDVEENIEKSTDTLILNKNQIENKENIENQINENKLNEINNKNDNFVIITNLISNDRTPRSSDENDKNPIMIISSNNKNNNEEEENTNNVNNNNVSNLNNSLNNSLSKEIKYFSNKFSDYVIESDDDVTTVYVTRKKRKYKK